MDTGGNMNMGIDTDTDSRYGYKHGFQDMDTGMDIDMDTNTDTNTDTNIDTNIDTDMITDVDMDIDMDMDTDMNSDMDPDMHCWAGGEVRRPGGGGYHASVLVGVPLTRARACLNKHQAFTASPCRGHGPPHSCQAAPSAPAAAR